MISLINLIFSSGLSLSNIIFYKAKSFCKRVKSDIFRLLFAEKEPNQTFFRLSFDENEPNQTLFRLSFAENEPNQTFFRLSFAENEPNQTFFRLSLLKTSQIRHVQTSVWWKRAKSDMFRLPLAKKEPNQTFFRLSFAENEPNQTCSDFCLMKTSQIRHLQTSAC